MTLVLQQVAAGRVRLDAPVRRYLPHLLPYRRPITVRQLLQHTSGLADYKNAVWPDLNAVVDARNRRWRPRELVRISARQPLAFRPGSRWAYSNTDDVVLGLLLRRVTHHSVEHLLRVGITDPLGLRDTHLAMGHRLVRPAMHGYEAVHRQLVDLTRYDMSVSWTTGAIVATPAEVDRFLQGLLSGRLLPRRLLHEMQRTVPAYPGFRYGLGLIGTRMCGHQLWGHIGGVPGYDTYAFADASGRRQVTVVASRSLSLPARGTTAVTRAVKEAFCRTLS